MNEENRKETADSEDMDFLSETRVFETLTETEPEEPLSATGVMETLTEGDFAAEEKEEKKEEQPEKESGSALKEILLFLRDLAIYMVIVFLMVEFLIRPIQVIGSSMYPTLNGGDRGVSNLLGYRLGHMKRFDIAIIYLDSKDEYLVKRVIGMPGETVSYTDGQLYINGEPVEEPFLDTDYAHSYDGVFMTDVEPVTLAEDEYFCLGDNRPRSTDSRYYGPFKADKIMAKGVFIVWPFSHFGAETW